MTFEFDPNERFVAVRGAYSNGVGQGISVLRLLLDMGASSTVVSPLALSGLVDAPERTGGIHRIETANGDVTAIEVRLPAFLRGHRLSLDFVRGEIELA